MRETVYTVWANGSARYHGLNAVDAMETIACASANGERVEAKITRVAADEYVDTEGDMYVLE